ncbi:MAG: hypothetical protein JJU23_11860 [Cyclobacteriaceae bacterium]|nr:hypothetical protein [Cyclobacteriaceae bacterium]
MKRDSLLIFGLVTLAEIIVLVLFLTGIIAFIPFLILIVVFFILGGSIILKNVLNKKED